MDSSKQVFSFDEAVPCDVMVFGGKGAGLTELVATGYPVPPGFIISTEACRSFMETGILAEALLRQIDQHVRKLEHVTGRPFRRMPEAVAGSAASTTPLLVSVRSGAPVSMPGMMDTVLNLGINPQRAGALAGATGSPRFAAEVLIRFHRMYSEIVLEADGEEIAEQGSRFVESGAPEAADRAFFEALWSVMADAEVDDVGTSVPLDPMEQIRGAVAAVFRSWNTRRATAYRRLNGIPDSLGTAVVIQAMVFGNLGSPSGSGVAFTRNPTTGAPGLYGEYLPGGQGEEVVAGIETPEPLAQAARKLPELFGEFERLARRLERQRRDVLDLEFTVEQGTLYLLQVRSAKRTASAAVRIAADLMSEGVASPLEALSKVSPTQIRDMERPRFAPAALAEARNAGRRLAKGIGASVGHANGVVVLDPDRAEAAAAQGEDIILLRETTSPFDLHGMIASRAIVTARGGATSHAAVVARALGLPAVVGCGELEIDSDGRTFTFGSRRLAEGVGLSVDGATGEVFEGVVPLTQPAPSSTGLNDVLNAARRAATDCRILGLCTTPVQAEATLARGGHGIAMRLVDLLVASGEIETLADELTVQRHRDRVDLSRLEPVLAGLLRPIFEAAGRRPVVVRAVDLIDGDAAEMLDLESLLVSHPGVGLPVGLAELLRVQIAAVAQAAGQNPGMPPPQFVVRHIADPRELIAMERIAADELSHQGRGALVVGALVTTPLGVEKASELAEQSGIVWFDSHRLMAGASGYPATVFTSAEPLDGYLRRDMLAEDPRLGRDDWQQKVFSALARVRVGALDCRIGVRLAREHSPELLSAYYRAGARYFATEPEDVHVAILELGKAALRHRPEASEVAGGAS